jgi:hypothetical protein
VGVREKESALWLSSQAGDDMERKIRAVLGQTGSLMGECFVDDWEEFYGGSISTLFS